MVINRKLYIYVILTLCRTMGFNKGNPREVIGIMGTNVMYQLVAATEGEFFSNDYLLFRVVRKKSVKEIFNKKITTLVPRVFYSTNENYNPGDEMPAFITKAKSIIEDHKTNIYISPLERNLNQDIEKPTDSLVIAELGANGFEGSNVFYSNNANLTGGRKIGYGILAKQDFLDGVANLGIHFAFVPFNEERRELYLEKGFKPVFFD